MQVIENLESHRKETCAVVKSLMHLAEYVGTLRGTEVIFMLKNKFGLSQDEAKKIYYKYRHTEPEEENPKKDENQPANPLNQPTNVQSTDQKIAMIMDYMKETSVKLEKIENDIEYLKRQVDQILRQM